MINSTRQYLWNCFYSRFFIVLVIQYPQSLNEQCLKGLKLFFQTATIEEINALINIYLKSDIINKYGEEINSSPYHKIYNN